MVSKLRSFHRKDIVVTSLYFGEAGMLPLTGYWLSAPDDGFKFLP